MSEGLSSWGITLQTEAPNPGQIAVAVEGWVGGRHWVAGRLLGEEDKGGGWDPWVESPLSGLQRTFTVRSRETPWAVWPPLPLLETLLYSPVSVLQLWGMPSLHRKWICSSRSGPAASAVQRPWRGASVSSCGFAPGPPPSGSDSRSPASAASAPPRRPYRRHCSEKGAWGAGTLPHLSATQCQAQARHHPMRIQRPHLADPQQCQPGSGPPGRRCWALCEPEEGRLASLGP